MDSYPVSNQVRLPPAPLAQGRSVFARPPVNRVLPRTQVRALVAGLGRSKPYATVVSELGELIQSYGEDARLFLLRILLREVDFLQLAAKDQLKVQLLSEELPKLLERPNFVSLVCRIFGPEHSSASFLSHFCSALGLSLAMRCIIARSLSYSMDKKSSSESRAFLLKTVAASVDFSRDKSLPDPALRELASFLTQDAELSDAQRDRGIKSLRSVYPRLDGLLRHRPVLAAGSGYVKPGEKSPEKQGGGAAGGRFATSLSLANTMYDLGYECLKSAAAFSQVLTHFSRLRAADVAQAIGFMARTTAGLKANKSGPKKMLEILAAVSKSKPVRSQADGKAAHATTWNAAAFVGALNDLRPVPFRWDDVYGSLDFAEFYVPDRKGFNLVVGIYRAATQGGAFPSELFLKSWKNTLGQLSFLQQAILADPAFFASVGRTQPPMRTGADATTATSWTSLSLIERVLALGDAGQAVLEILKPAMEAQPELVLVGTATVRPSLEGALAQTIAAETAPRVLANYPSSKPALDQLWKRHGARLAGCFIEACAAERAALPKVSERAALPKVFEVAQDMGVLEDMLESKRYAFALDLASLAHTRQALALKPWLKAHIDQLKDPFVVACLAHLRDNSREQTAGVFFQCLFDETSAMSEQSAQELQRLYKAYAAEKEAEELMRSVYDKDKTRPQRQQALLQMVESLGKYRASADLREKEVFNQVWAIFIEESQRFHQYPDYALETAAQLLGLIISREFLQPAEHSQALHYILKQLSSANPKMVNFGLWALERFGGQLGRWPSFCEGLAQPPIAELLRKEMPQIARLVEGIMASGGAGSAAAREVKQKGLAERKFEGSVKQGAEPEKKVKDTIHFLVNNISGDNVLQKVEEIRGVLQVQHYGYFCRYVLRRLPIEKNLLPIYEKFFDHFDDRKLNKQMLEATYERARELVSSELKNVQQKNALYNVGTWLGRITLARNKPILMRNLVLPELLLGTYGKDMFVPVVKFVSNVLRGVSDSKVFRPPNPWLMDIMSLLKEIYEQQGAKMIVRIEIENLCKKDLKVGLEKVKPSKRFPPPGSQQPPPAADDVVGIYIDPSIELFRRYQQLQQLIPMAIDRAICDVIQPVVERSVTIASVTSSHLIEKDFATATDVKVVHAAAQQMVTKLTRSLALVTSKDPLQKSISQRLTEGLEKALQDREVQYDKRSIDNICAKVAKDNLAFACKFVEKAAADRAGRELDKHLHEFYKRVHQRSGADSSWQQQAAAAYGAELPPNLRLAQMRGPLAQMQIKVYQDFGVGAAAAPAMMAAVEGPSSVASVPPAQPQPQPQPQMQWQQPKSNQQVLQALVSNLNKLIEAIQDYKEAMGTPVSELKDTPKAVRVHQTIRRFPVLLSEVLQDDAIMAVRVLYLTFAYRVFKELCTRYGDGVLTTTSLCAVLKYIAGISSACVEELPKMLLERTDKGAEAKYEYVQPVLGALIRNQLVTHEGIDVQLSKDLLQCLAQQQKDEPALREIKLCIKTCLFLVQTFVIKEQVVPASSFGNIIDALGAALANLPKNVIEPFKADIENLSKVVRAGFGRPGVLAEFGRPVVAHKQRGLDEKVFRLLDKWYHIIRGEGADSEQRYTEFLQHVQRQQLLQTPEQSNLVFRLMINICVDWTCRKEQPANAPQGLTLDYMMIDALAKLVVFFVKFMPGELPNKVSLLSAFLQVSAHVLIHDHDTKAQVQGAEPFNQKMYLRLYTNLLADLNSPDPILDSSNVDVLVAFARAFHTLRPAVVPGFAFAWIELISHRMFMPKLLIARPLQCHAVYKTLLVDLLEFQYPYLRNAEVTVSVRLLYKGTLRLLLVLLHDFPDLLNTFSFELCEVIPETCVQMRNLVLAAMPKTQHSFPSPLARDIKVENCKALSVPPRVAHNTEAVLAKFGLLEPLEQYIYKTREPQQDFHRGLRDKIRLPPGEPRMWTPYNLPLINSLVLHLGIKGSVSQSVEGTCVEVFHKLVANLDPQGRYHVLNAMANQLRYPNSHTWWFYRMLLALFLRSDDNSLVKEQIIRVLLERMVVYRPHPWGLIKTFVQLSKDPRYNTKKQAFTKRNPELASLFEHVYHTLSALGGNGSS